MLLQLPCLGRDHSFTSISIEDGLSNNHVNAIFKDSYGYIWLGTLDGIDRYDGIEVKSFSYRFPGVTETVTSITEDYQKTLWVGTTTGLFHYNGMSDCFERLNLGAETLAVNTFALLRDSSLCVGTSKGLYRVNTISLQWEKLQISGDPVGDDIIISGLYLDDQGICWMSSSRGLLTYSFASTRSELFLCPLTPKDAYNSFSSICSIDSVLYLGTTSVGIIEFDMSRNLFSKGVSIDNNLILNLTSDHKELIFAGTDGGGLKMINVRSRKVENYISREHDPESLASNSVYSFFLGEEGRFWVGTYSAGLCYSKNITRTFRTHQVTTDYPEVNKSIRSFYFSPDGSQYFGTRNGLARLSRDGSLDLFKASIKDENGLRSNIILSVFPFMGDILIGTYGGGLSRFSVADQKMKPFLEGIIFSSENIYAFDIEDSGDLWITSFNGLYRYSPEDGNLDHFNTQNSGLEDDQIFEITFDSRGRLWIGSMSGPHAYILNANELEALDLSIIKDNTFKTNYIYEDQAGNIWICTERGGLIVLDPDLSKSTHFRVDDGLPDNSVCAIIERNQGDYWISTLKGLCRYSSHKQKFSKCYISDGLPGPVFTPAATYLDSDGTLFFGNEKGLVYCTSDDADEKPLASSMVITDFYVSGKEVKPGENSILERPIEETRIIHLNDRMNSIGFRFVALNYTNPADNYYQYKLEGYDNEWKDNGSDNSVFFESLKPGSYLFTVRHGSEDGDESVSSAELRIIIHQLIFTSTWFFVFLFLLLMTGVFIMIRFKARLPEVVRNVIGLDLKYEKYKGSRMEKSQCEIIISELKQYMEEGKPYLNADLKIADLAEHIHRSTSEISQVLNQDLNQSFSDFVNKCRVREVKRLMKDKAYEKYTLVALAEQSGFNSKTSFYRIFKNETGKTPADYLKELNNHHSLKTVD
ncbi:MAG: two-component regulator propeller domain-containing protein [Bacteroides sp.]|nr:two-component regulator propeller domain-containing protein [Bacteroides sp.]